MSNPQKGEVSFQARGGLTFTLRFSINALCELETELGCPVAEIGRRFGDSLGLVQLRAIFRAGLTDRHGPVTPEEAGVLIEEIGMARAGELVAEAFQAAFPEAAKATAGPRKAARR